MSASDFEVFAEYNQFYLWDAGMGRQAPEEYTDEDIERMIKVADHVVVIQPVKRTTVPVRVEVYTEDPGVDAAPWEHIAEVSLAIPTGALEVHESTGGPVWSLDVAPGTYRVRALFSDLENKGRYLLQVWPGEARPLRIVKQWSK